MSEQEKQFRILQPVIGSPTHIPWDMVAPHEKQAKVNHDQDLEKLNSRGGLGALEIYMVMNGLSWKARPYGLTEQDATRWLVGKLQQYWLECGEPAPKDGGE